ncbi:MAG: hypothetical protein M1829_001011 [Trizodia sp. TS-e1964]|nr:MAG: hypothetical protein M1829_001011 [Trizodia sp. TS-e1964]
MAHLSPIDCEIIQKYPFGNTLDHLIDLLQEAEWSNEPGTGAADHSGQKHQDAISKLLLALLGHQAAFNLPSKIQNNNLANDLLMLYGSIKYNTFDYDDYHELSRLVIMKAPDTDIWNVVFSILLPTTPKTIDPVMAATSATYASSSQQGSEQTNRHLKEALFHELKNCTYRNVDGFFSKFFDDKAWTKRSKEIYFAMKARHTDGRWGDFPDPPEESAVWKWLDNFQKEFLSDAQGAYHKAESTRDLFAGEAKRQLDIFVKRRDHTAAAAGSYDWKDILVIGEHKQSKSGLKELLLQLSRYVREMFICQPTRRFIHGFFIHGNIMELWVFDRSGPFSSGPFNIHEEPEQFIRAIAGYALMSREEFG